MGKCGQNVGTRNAPGIRADIIGARVSQTGNPSEIAQPGELGVNEMMLDHLRDLTDMMRATICAASGIWRGGANLACPS